MSDYNFISRLNELKEEYASQKGWNDEDNYWYENDEHLYEAECYAYGILEKETKENGVDFKEEKHKKEMIDSYAFFMEKYFSENKAFHFPTNIVEHDDIRYVLEHNGRNIVIEFDPSWSQLVYTVNGKGPFAHTSYESIWDDIRDVLALEDKEKLDKLQDLLRESGWKVETNPFEFLLSKESATGESYSLSVPNSSFEEAVDEIQFKVDSFDPQELVDFWVENNPGIDLSEAHKDAKSFRDMLIDLSTVVNGFTGEEIAQSNRLLAERLNAFYKDFDHYGFVDCLDSTNTEEVLDSELAVQLGDSKAVAGILEVLYDIKENGEPDEEQFKVLNGLIEEVELIQDSFEKSLDDKLAYAKEKSSHTENSNDKDISIERDVLGE